MVLLAVELQRRFFVMPAQAAVSNNEGQTEREMSLIA